MRGRVTHMSATEQQQNKPHHDVTIIINGSDHVVESDDGVLSFDAVVNLAFPDHAPDTIFVVTFENGVDPKSGELVEGQSVKVHKGEGEKHTEFDVDDSGRS
jgi:hypothetical protein